MQKGVVLLRVSKGFIGVMGCNPNIGAAKRVMQVRMYICKGYQSKWMFNKIVLLYIYCIIA